MQEGLETSPEATTKWRGHFLVEGYDHRNAIE